MNRNLMTRGIAMLLAMVLVLAGCATGKPAETTAPTENTTVPAPEQTTGAAEGTPSLEGDITFFSVNLNLDGMTNHYLMAYPNDDGTVYVEYVGDVKKIGTNMDASVMAQIAAAVNESGMVALNNENVYEDGTAVGSAYVEYADGNMLSISYSGQIPQTYQDAYAKLDASFQALTADLEVYVPVPMVMGEVDEVALEELLAILENTGIQELDTFSISDVVKDDAFAFVMGLSSAEGVAVGTSCTAMMMTTPYSLVVATLEEGADAQTVRDDFVNSLDWHKWVCVMPTGAMVAQKDNMILCLMAADRMYDQTVAAVQACGWTNVEEIPFVAE